ncbi:N-acetyltransferase [Pelomonas sp. KK5]|uniref:GNAT family N-acetyltransferase n=1 Tax=Pelomonas sp. KK5 TaxID=1855730 RepID=UPI001180A148|nr:GNAT family N-acetyltransferase [Pelomonas sp. KK5]
MTTIAAASAVPADQLHAAFREAFADYLIGPFQVPLAQWPQFLARQGVELPLNRVALDDGGAILAFAFVAQRPGRWRLATMGARPAARGSGAAPRLLDDFMQRAREAGMAAVELEVFAQNERARRLYEGRGFVARSELLGWQAEPAGGEPAPWADLLEREAAFAWIAARPYLDDLPLQQTPALLAANPNRLQALQQGSALLLFAETAPLSLTVSGLYDDAPEQADALALARALRAAHPAHRIVVPALQRPDLGGRVLAEAGFERQPLHQLLMRASLA